MSLDINKSYKAILDGARQSRFVTYGEVAAASGVEWKKARRPLPLQLDQLVYISHERGWPLISAIVVSKENVESGRLEGESLAGFMAAVAKVGLTVDDAQAFLHEQQQAVFEWSKTAPDELGMSSDHDDDAGGPRFVHYFNPVLEALRAHGGSATPDKVFAWIKDHHDLPAAEIEGVNKGGQSKFENKVAWARFYLAKAGLIDAAKRGVWALTSEGLNTSLTRADALQIFRNVQSQFKAAGDEEEPAPEVVTGQELFADPARKFWFVGAAWGADDQTPRFLAEGIWQNGYHDKFGDEVRRMRPGDRIAIKAAFVRKHNLPFDNRGQPVSCMRIKAIGTIAENLDDGRTVRVDWEVLDPPRDWFFYTYRVTVVEADPNDELARRLIVFAFAGARQDYDFWIKQPYFAKKYGPEQKAASLEEFFETDALETEEEAAVPSYTADNIADDGCFLPKEQINGILARIESKRNLVLQGPPGTGKTWLAKRLAYALIGSKDPKVTRDRLRVMQFHPSLSYEDFVRGWRPSGDGKLALIDGVFLEIVEAAKAEPDRPFVLVIEEINRGNPAQIFGEVLTLLEDTKRSRDEAMELAYRREPGERVYVPRNLYVIGTMNIADRSLALVDLALRRRFAFVSLEPRLNGVWREWCANKCGLAADTISLIEHRMNALNEEIGQDRSLGQQYRIGHSCVTPAGALTGDAKGWFSDVIRTEIVPLLEEYWFDAPEKVAAAQQKLLEGL
ncbi:AAA family ATPase [Mesorhizobium sp. M0482]|uniref:AAA family ATPase n=1 Tax=Mesorhizobium sp. M0482 TaxID=2956948 RepID=UPI00333CC8AD